jgi:hypothetical protein
MRNYANMKVDCDKCGKKTKIKKGDYRQATEYADNTTILTLIFECYKCLKKYCKKEE